MQSEKIMEAIRQLRAATGKNQVSFAVEVGKSYPMIQRYEGVKPPPPDELPAFIVLARKYQRSDLAAIFKAAMLEDLDPNLIAIIREPENGEPEQKAAPQSHVHKRKVRAG